MGTNAAGVGQYIESDPHLRGVRPPHPQRYGPIRLNHVRKPLAPCAVFCDDGVLNVINKPNLVRLAQRYPATASHVEAWYRAARRAEWRGLHEVRKEFPSADQVGNVLIFNVLGGSYRLIVRVSWVSQRIFVKALLTHKEYDRKEWMKWA